ncbi:PCC domain-containing protein [Streptomyces sp. NPDC007905]|uniref:PCC domain-containing protein n=1 Tax=Streptomyces sp. NPDC007905 TaxID=3364788 RepID=UPI0036EE7441
MRATQFRRGRKFVFAMDHGEGFFTTLEKLCAEHEIRSGYIPTFIGGFRRARLVGTCGAMDNPEARPGLGHVRRSGVSTATR